MSNLRLTHAALLTSILLAAPLAFAHNDGLAGVPKPYCEDVKDDRWVHDYLGGAVVLTGIMDGSLEAECPYGAGSENPTFDGHFEFAYGGALLVSRSTPECGLPYEDHPEFPSVWVVDDVLTTQGGSVAFSVAVDTVDVTNGQFPCGDGDTDLSVDCVDFCAVGFPAGLDGTYAVFVQGTAGHVFTNPPPACYDNKDNDGDGAIDNADPGCTDAKDATE